MNKLVATIAKRILGPRRAVRYYCSAQSLFFPVKFEILWHLSCHDKLQELNRYEGKAYSQNGEDGIIAAIFRKVGVTNKFCVEFGVGEAPRGSGNELLQIECNTAYLTKKRRWSFLWMDAGGCVSESVRMEYITAENVNELFTKYDVPKAFDLLSIDIDYNTYWVWKAIEGFSPRVVVVEYNSFFPPTESVVVPYDPQGVWDGTNYFGASLLALTKLGAEKGYRLVACDNKGINAFFVRKDLELNFVSRSIEEIYRPPGYGKVVNGRHVGYHPSNKQFIAV
jgi:hypothetical protein